MLALLRERLLPRLLGAAADLVEAAWRDLFAATRSTTVGAITSLALAAVDTALWDLRCLRANAPLWRVADVERLSAIRDVVGPHFDIMVDANQSMTRADSLRRAELAVVDGHAVAPETPGLGIAWDRDAMDDRRVA